MTKKALQEKLHPVCLDCRQACKQKAVVMLLKCARYRRKDKQLELSFTYEKHTGKKQ